MLILASSSPRRQDLLRNARILFKTHPADIPEALNPGEAPQDYVRRLAREKACAVFEQLQPPAGTLVLGADTTVVIDGAVLGKPNDEADAARMLRQLSGRQHEVVTGVCLIGADQVAPGSCPAGPACSERKAGDVQRATGNGKRETFFEDVRCETTQVCFSELTDVEIENYVSTGEPMDKAGAYAIQGAASRWIPRIEGCYFNVVGLPVPLVCRMLREHGAM
jgi:septum formation protein